MVYPRPHQGVPSHEEPNKHQDRSLWCPVQSTTYAAMYSATNTRIGDQLKSIAISCLSSDAC